MESRRAEFFGKEILQSRNGREPGLVEPFPDRAHLACEARPQAGAPGELACESDVGRLIALDPVRQAERR